MSVAVMNALPRIRVQYVVFVGTTVVATLIWLLLDRDSPWVVYPRGWILDLQSPLGDGMKFLAREYEIGPIKFSEITRGFGWLISQPFEFLGGILAKGFTFYKLDAPPDVIPPLPWIGIAAVFTLIAWNFGTAGLGIWTASTFILFAVFDLWESAMLTMASVLIAVVMGVVGGTMLGIWGYRNKFVDAVLQPFYDVMQTLPLFSYLVPMILFFGFGPIAALMATVIFAMPPMARVTTQAMYSVPATVGEFGRIAGCSRFQLTWLVMVPAARKELLLGVNQVIMLSLAVVIVASIIGAGGLGGDVLKALRSMRIGDALAAGLAITFMAIMLDRVSYLIAMRRPVHETEDPAWYIRHKLLIASFFILVGTTVLSLAIPAIHTWPEEWTISAGRYGNGLVTWISTTFDSQIGALRDGALRHVLKPTKIFFLAVPWSSFVLVVGVVGWLLGGWRTALLGCSVFVAIAALGYWKKAMISLYLVFLSVIAAMAIGFLLGLWAGLNRHAHRVLILIVDLLQTLPTFVYLIPVVMIFSIGDFPALIAITLYAIAPAIRYTDAGIRHVRESLVEGARMSGCDRRQILWLVKVPLALPTILLGLNQVVMMAFGMLVITALVGSRGLEELTLRAIARVEPGDGLLAGLGIAGMAIVFDRYIKAGNRKLADYLGIPVPR